jgi:head-tail adaptor
MPPPFRSTITVERPSRSGDGAGGHAISYASTGTPERGTIAPASAGERIAGEREDARITHVAYLRRGANVLRGDRLSGATVPTVIVQAVIQQSRDHVRCTCEEIQQGG